MIGTDALFRGAKHAFERRASSVEPEWPEILAGDDTRCPHTPPCVARRKVSRKTKGLEIEDSGG